MSWPDIVNGLYELLAGGFVLLNVRQLLQDKQLKGVSVLATAFFFSWGVWNLYYYPHLEQWVSFVGGLSIVAANCWWLHLMLYYGGIYRSAWRYLWR